jgi:hypothetical protein
MSETDTGLRGAADELYRVSPANFMSARKHLADSAGDKALAVAIKGLRKPAAAAAIVNSFVHANPDGLAGLTDIGDRLRVAEENGDAAALRALSGERRKAVADAMTAATEGSGSSVSASTKEAVEATFQAAVIDTAAASAVASGMLLKPLSPGGDIEGATALEVVGRAPSRPKAKAQGKSATTKAAEQAARKAREAADQAEQAAADAACRLSDAEDTLHGLRSERNGLRQRIADLRDELSDLEDRDSTLDGELIAAQHARRDAATAAEKAKTNASALRRKAPK